MSFKALTGCEFHDGVKLYEGAALLLNGEVFEGIIAPGDLPEDAEIIEIQGGTVFPGFIDLQINGGGGVMFNDETSLDGLRTMSEALRSVGTAGFLPTLITDTPQKVSAAIAAVREAIEENVYGIIGLHLEGPHLSIPKKGAHHESLIRPMEDADEEELIAAADLLPNLLITVAPENVRPDQIKRLSEAGIIVSLGHSDCTYDQAMAAFDAGARMATHLYNAMSQLGNREPGLLGAVLDHGSVSAGLIADAIHVHPAAIRAALNAKRGPGEIFLVTDAMATIGSDIDGFELNGRWVSRKDGRLTLATGNLAGADLEFRRAISVMEEEVGISKEVALEMATGRPASLLTRSLDLGRFVSGKPPQLFHMTDESVTELEL